MPATDRRPSPVRADAADAGALIARLAAEPRPAGGPAEARARALCEAFLRERGFDVRTEAFAYSAFPGLWATPLGGAVSIVLLALAGHLGYRGHASYALAVLALGAALVAIAGLWLARAGVLGIPVLRRRGANLVARRGDADGRRVWLVAHLDSKSQPIPIGLRAAGITVSVIAWVAALAIAGSQTFLGAGVADLWPWVSGSGAVAGVPVLLSVVGERSPGALDNATGCAAALLAAAQLPNETPVGVLLTSAEELGLAGGRAWARDADPGVAINFDGIDDSGPLGAMFTGAAPRALIEAVRRAAALAGVPLTPRRLLPGILVDGVALADRGWQVVTLSRGTLATVSRIHRPGDTADRLTGAGVAEAAHVAARAAALLTHSSEA